MAAALSSSFCGVKENEMELEEDIEDDGTSTDLGYLEKSESWRLRSEYFPSKVGGKPSWLNLSEVPTSSQVQCENCQKPCLFLCQIYAPIEHRDDCFHRTLFIFMCTSAECCKANANSSFKILRCQLPRKNNFYSYDPPVESEDWKSEVNAEVFGKLCYVCNLRSTSHCGKCRCVYYCSKEHQVADWKAGHRSQCCSDEGMEQKNATLLLPEWELVTEMEPSTDEKTSHPEKSNAQRLEEFQNLVRCGQAGTLHGDAAADEDLQAMPESKEDAVFKKFKRRIARSPTQVLRYEREGQPLWVLEENQHGQVPPCTYCGSPRVFECQILPQMLNYLGLDQVGNSVDWGTLAIFTCQQSCSQGPAYKEEHLVKQDFAS